MLWPWRWHLKMYMSFDQHMLALSTVKRQFQNTSMTRQGKRLHGKVLGKAQINAIDAKVNTKQLNASSRTPSVTTVKKPYCISMQSIITGQSTKGLAKRNGVGFTTLKISQSDELGLYERHLQYERWVLKGKFSDKGQSEQSINDYAYGCWLHNYKQTPINPSLAIHLSQKQTSCWKCTLGKCWRHADSLWCTTQRQDSEVAIICCGFCQ